MGGDEKSGGSFLRFLSALIDKEFFGFLDDDVSEAMERRQHETQKNNLPLLATWGESKRRCSALQRETNEKVILESSLDAFL